MEARITFRSEIYIEGKDIGDIEDKFQNTPLFSADALEKYGAEFIEVVSVEDADSNKDLTNKWYAR